MRRLIKKFLKDERGHYTFIALVGAIPFLFLLVQIINLGSSTLDNGKAQNAADAMAQSHAAWTARSLNVISMNNVTMSQAVTLGTNSAALHGTISELAVHSAVALGSIGVNYKDACVPLIKLAALPPPVGTAYAAMAALCTAEHLAASTPAIASLKKAWDIHRDYKPSHGLYTANKTIRALSSMNERIIERAPEEIGAQLEELARIHDINDWYVHRDCTENNAICDRRIGQIGLSLPLETSNLAVPEMCILALGAENPKLGLISSLPGIGQLRGLLGYDTFEQRGMPSQAGPDTWGGSDSTRYIPDHIVELTDISQYLYAYDKFYRKNRILGIFFGVYFPAPNVFIDLISYFRNIGADPPADVLSKRDKAQEQIKNDRDKFDEADLDAVDENGDPIYTPEQRQEIEDARRDGKEFGIGENAFASRGPGYAKTVDRDLFKAAVHLDVQEAPTKRENNFFRRLKFEWLALCLSDFTFDRSPGTETGGNRFSSEVAGFARQIINFGLDPLETPKLFWLKERQIGGVAGRLLGRNDAETPKYYKPLIVVHRDPAVRLGGRFASFRERGVYAMAEAITLSSGGTDLYSQLWGGRLTRITQVEELDVFVRSMEQLATREFDDLVNSYSAARQSLGQTTSQIGVVHAH